jgi:hypothetical protein
MSWVHICWAPRALSISRPARPGAKRASATVLFEDHPYLGPCPVDRKGAGRILPEAHWFWRTVSQWAQQGGKTDSLGRALYDPTIPLKE